MVNEGSAVFPRISWALFFYCALALCFVFIRLFSVFVSGADIGQKSIVAMHWKHLKAGHRPIKFTLASVKEEQI